MIKYELPHMGGSTLSNRLMAEVIREIREGAFSRCDRLPSELELAERYHVSRSVIRDLLSDLEREGFVSRGRGIGTLIHRQIANMPGRLDIKFEFFDLIRGAGFQPSCDQVRLREQIADEKLAAALEIETGDRVVVCEKRVLASGRPVIFSIDHLSMHLFEEIDYRSLDWSGSVFDLLERHCGVSVDSDIAKIAAVIGPPRIRQSLLATDEQALLFIDEVGYYKLSKPILHSYVYYLDLCDFTILRKRI